MPISHSSLSPRGRVRRLAAAIPLLVTAFLAVLPLAACGGGGSSSTAPAGSNRPANAAPTVALAAPTSPVEVSRGGLLLIQFAANDPDDVAQVTIWADLDGDPATTGDRFPVAGPYAELDGALQEFVVDTVGVPSGVYSLVAEVTDGRKTRRAVSAAALTVVERSWAKGMGGTELDTLSTVAAVADGSVAAAGDFVGTAVFGAGEPGQTFFTSGGEEDAFVARFEEDGSLGWVRHGESVKGVSSIDIAADEDGSFLYTGSWIGVNLFLNAGEPDERGLSSNGSDDLFLARYGNDGSLEWAVRAGGPGSDTSRSVALLSDGSAYLTGRYQDQAVFGPGEPGEITLNGSGEGDAFLAHYHADGTLDWVVSAGGADRDFGVALAVMPDDCVVLAGSYIGSITLGAGEPNETTLTGSSFENSFLARYNADGTLAWAEPMGSDNKDQPGGLVVLSDGSIVIAGGFRETARFGVGTSNQIDLVSTGRFDHYLARFTEDGKLVWAVQAGGDRQDIVRGLAVLADDSVLMGGAFSGTATFGLGEPNELSLTSNGKLDGFFAQFASNGTFVRADHIGSDNRDEGLAVAAMPDGSPLFAGLFSKSAIFGLGDANETSLSSAGSADGFLARYNADGDF